ncbi:MULTISPECIES: porin family protein [unclassified Arcicella]|uniref:porin family protein n=1 Tax=unclassified Arcicella TaxID=2644986 RepID=UPI002861BC4C|nr:MULTISPECIES: porin family protein [unclassified Arcicella]MDR6564611.1 hypothetical protein [Arcicella sp. BE51]MDR6814461.1 hypothetical protein [Arcicella sp. BE140]MDR6825783.1 hypothetical protein [Arcicella sp. BE139]
MKKIIFLILSYIAFSFTTNAQSRFGIKAGANFANLTFSSGGVSSTMNSITGANIGVTFETRLSDRFILRNDVLWSQKGGITEDSGNNIKTTIDYLEVPFNFLYEPTYYSFVGVGPYVGYGFTGTIVSNGKSSEMTFEDGGFKRLDYGLNLTAGYEVFEGLVLSANYSLGFGNIIDSNTAAFKNKVIGISVTKFFKSK